MKLGLFLAAAACLALAQDTQIVVARGEHNGVMAAAKDLQRDLTKITGVTPNIVRAMPAGEGIRIVIGSADCAGGKALLASVGVPVNDLAGKWEVFKYRAVNAQILAIAGSSFRGTIFGIYDFEHKHLGVDPLWFWDDHDPPVRKNLVFEAGMNYGPSKEPTWKYRGWTLNDHPQLIEWMESGLVHRTKYKRYPFVMHPEVIGRLAEAALRLKMNMLTWYFVDIDWQPDYELLRQVVDRGLFVTQHQMEGLGADVGFWDEYWRNHNPGGKPQGFSYRKDPQAFREFWTYYIRRWAEFSPQVVWEANLRGWADGIYTESTLPDGGTEPQRAAVVNDAIAEQARLVRRYDPNAEIMTTLYAEMGRYYDQGWIRVPDGVTTGFADRGMSGMAYSRKFWTEPRDPRRRYGQYFHTQYFGGGPQVAKCTPIETYLKPNLEAIFQRGDTHHMLLAMNELRSQQIEIRAIAEMLWNYPAFDAREYLLRYCREQFGEAAAPKVAALYDAYYEKYPHKMVSDGFKKYASYHKVMEPMFTVIGNLLNIESGTTDGLALQYDYKRDIYEQGIRDLGGVLEQARALRPSIPPHRRGFFDYEFTHGIRLVRGIYKLSIATQDAIARLRAGDRPGALAALLDARPLTEDLYQAFRGERQGERWRYWFRSSTNKDFYLLYNLYQKARLRLETEWMNQVVMLEPQRRPWLGNVVMHDAAKAGDAVYGWQADRINMTVANGSPFSLTRFPLRGTFQIGGVQTAGGKGIWGTAATPDYGLAYRFRLEGKATVYVAEEKGVELTWLAAQGFRDTGQTLEVGEWDWPYRYRGLPPTKTHTFQIFAKDFSRGEVALGRNPAKGRYLPYLVFVKPALLAFENFRRGLAGWQVNPHGGRVAVADIRDYAAELRPSVYDLTTVPRYTPLVLRGLKLESAAQSSTPAVAIFKLAAPAQDDFTVDFRFQAGQTSGRSVFALCAADAAPVAEVALAESGAIVAGGANVGQYQPERWYEVKLRVRPRQGTFSVAVQDDTLRVTSADGLALAGACVPDRVRLTHAGRQPGAWVMYNAIAAYLQ
ncbi:MAG: glycosyl hydrolase 115 family protein [Acidobacteria bacterium]|nr:glycosyl hydrolase 115 family protein [Acidobacteriota bacterium]